VTLVCITQHCEQHFTSRQVEKGKGQQASSIAHWEQQPLGATHVAQRSKSKKIKFFFCTAQHSTEKKKAPQSRGKERDE